MGLPTALEGLDEAANTLHRETYPDRYKDTGPDGEKTDEAPPDAAVEPPPADAAAPPAPETPPTTPPADTAAPGTMPEGSVARAEYDALQHKFDVLMGKYNAEVPRTAAELKALREEIAALKATPAGTPAPGTSPASGDVGTRLQRLEQEYGPEFVEDMRTVFREEARHEVRKEIEGVKAQVEGVAQVTAHSAQTQYVAALERAVPDFRTIMGDPKFAAYMNEDEGRSGISRLAFAREFEKAHNAARVAAYYLDFKQQQSAHAPTPSPARPKKDSLVTPTTTPTGAATTTTKEDVPYMRASELDKFARDVNAGLYRGREKDLQAFQARLDAAQAAGRIIPG